MSKEQLIKVLESIDMVGIRGFEIEYYENNECFNDDVANTISLK